MGVVHLLSKPNTLNPSLAIPIPIALGWCSVEKICVVVFCSWNSVETLVVYTNKLPVLCPWQHPPLHNDRASPAVHAAWQGR